MNCNLTESAYTPQVPEEPQLNFIKCYIPGCISGFHFKRSTMIVWTFLHMQLQTQPPMMLLW